MPQAVVGLVKSTGGETLTPAKLDKGVAPLLDAVHRQWVLDLIPAKHSDQKWHSLAFKTVQKDLQLSVPAHLFIP